VIPDDERTKVNETCRGAASRLSGARDAEVKIATLNSVTGSNPPPDGAGDWLGELEEEAEGHRGELNPGSLAEVHDAIDGVRRTFLGRDPAAGPETVAGNAGRGYRRGRKAMKRAKESGEAEDFHDWRKRSKDLRYQLEILGPRLPEEFDQLRKEATDLADRLGDLHDLDVLAGTWSAEEADEFHRAIADLDQIDPSLWR